MSSRRKPRERKVYERSPAGLRDALFDQMEDLRDGISSADEAIAFAQLSNQVLKTAEAEHRQKAIELQERQTELEERQTALAEAEERRNQTRMLTYG